MKDVIIRGGENISQTDIENHITKHPKIEEAIIVGVPDEVLGEEIFAFIKVKNGCLLDKQELFDYLSGKIAKYKITKYFEFIDQLPITSTGKIKRNSLKQMAITILTAPVPINKAINQL